MSLESSHGPAKLVCSLSGGSNLKAMVWCIHKLGFRFTMQRFPPAATQKASAQVHLGAVITDCSHYICCCCCIQESR